MDLRPEEILHRITAVERRLGGVEIAVNETTAEVQALAEQPTETPQAGHQNLLIGGDLDISRNNYLYETDIIGTGGNDENVSHEVYNWFTSAPDTSIETTCSINSGDNTLYLDTPDLVPEDAGLEIVIEGAGTDGADLITTIQSYTDASHADLDDSAATTVTGARVRWRLLTLMEDSTDEDEDTDPMTNSTVKGPLHTMYDPLVPNWDRENGWIKLSSNDWVCQPLRQNLIRPSLQYINSFIYKLDGEGPYSANVFVGIWDNSEGRKCFLEGDPIELTAEVVGAPVSTTPRTYFVVFYTNWDLSIGTSEVTVNAPVTFTNSEYVHLEWTQPAGIVRTEIYRKTGSTYHLLNNPYPQSSYNDKGATRRTTIGFPAVDKKRMIAYMETTRFNFAPARSDTWMLAQLNIPVPNDYDASKTTDKQWFVMGLTEPIESESESESESEGGDAILIDRISLDDKVGIFTRSPWDFEAKRGITSAPTGGDVGTAGGGGGIPPGGTNHCPVFEMPIEVEMDGARMEVKAIDLVDNEDIYRIVNLRDEAVGYKAAISPFPQMCYEMRAAEHVLRASFDEPVFIDEAQHYKSLKDIRNGDMILAKEGLIPVESNRLLLKKRHTVKIELEGEEKGFWIAGIGCHNRKENPE